MLSAALATEANAVTTNKNTDKQNLTFHVNLPLILIY